MSAVDVTGGRQGAWHQSGLSTLLDGCARQYALEYVLNIPRGEKPSTVVGTAMHHAIEVHEQARIDGQDTPDYDQFVAAAHEELERLLPEITEETWGHSKADADDLREQVRWVCWNWWNYELKATGRSMRDEVLDLTPVSLETYFRVPLVPGTLPIGGSADALYEHPELEGHWILVDWKTAGRLSDYSPEKAQATKWSQATQYSVGAVLSEHLPPDSLDVLTFRYGAVRKEKVEGTRKEGARFADVDIQLRHVELLRDRILAAEEEVSKGEFLPDPSYRFCKPGLCTYYDRCQVSGELAKPMSQLLPVVTEMH